MSRCPSRPPEATTPLGTLLVALVARQEVGRALHEGIAESRLVVLSDVGHFSGVEGAEQFNHEVRSFLAKNRD